MAPALGLLLLAAQAPPVSLPAGAADQSLTLSAHQLPDAAGVAPEIHLQATLTCRRGAATSGDIEGFIAVNPGSDHCRGQSPDRATTDPETTLWIGFQATIAVSKCIPFERAAR
jgi:hypothetical protein